MPASIKVLIAPVQAAAAQTTQYTANGLSAIIDKFTATNTSAAAADISVHLVQQGNAAIDANRLVKKTLQAGETYTFPEVTGHVLNVGGFVSTIASVAGAVVLRASGREIS